MNRIDLDGRRAGADIAAPLPLGGRGGHQELLGGDAAHHRLDRRRAGAVAHEGPHAARLGLAGWPRAAETVGDLVALVLLAHLVTATTRVDDMLDTVERALRPLRRFGVRPDRVALAISLVLRAVPATAEAAGQTRDAARARGLERDPRATLTPFVVRVVRDARLRGEALHARGVGDD